MLALHAEEEHVAQAYQRALQQRHRAENGVSPEILLIRVQAEPSRVAGRLGAWLAQHVKHRARPCGPSGDHGILHAHRLAHRQRFAEAEHLRLLAVGHRHLHHGDEDDRAHPDRQHGIERRHSGTIVGDRVQRDAVHRDRGGQQCGDRIGVG